jgi:hypothetical protein
VLPSVAVAVAVNAGVATNVGPWRCWARLRDTISRKFALPMPSARTWALPSHS